ncbi:hypothetical protein F4779DRAFT_584224 [Xylariaceae sp. FL0662B]|nr:hypothetical protein F4779DRAFT_584224 [Xylariaceae sp. FL0662B]
MTRAGYLSWRTKQKAQAAAQISALLSSPAPLLPSEAISRIAALVRKENLRADAETQVLEDVACLVFLDDQLDGFVARGENDGEDQDKVVGILRKTWDKMSPRGRELAGDIMPGRSRRAAELVGLALGGS